MNKKIVFALSAVAFFISYISIHYVIFYFYRNKERKRNILFPLEAKHITSEYGFRIHPKTGKYELHAGTDYRAKEGENIYASGDGIVTKVWEDNINGKALRVKYKDIDDLEFTYIHLSDNKIVKEGEEVKRGQIIGKTGNTGRSTAPHLHLSIRNTYGVKIDPESVLDDSKIDFVKS